MKLLSRFTKKLSILFRRDRFRSELDEEMAFHRTQAEEELIAGGMCAQDARAAALRQFGNVTRMKENSHQVIGFRFEHVLWDCRYALRRLSRAPGFSIAVVLTLALGIGATTAIFTLVHATLLRRLEYPGADRIVNISDVRLHGRSTGGLVGVQPLLGRAIDEEDTKPNVPEVAVLSYALWQQAFSGDKGVIGKAVTLDGKTATIVGVMPQGFQMPGATELWMPSTFGPGSFRGWRGEGTRFVNVFAKMKAGVQLSAAQNDLKRIGDQLRQEHPDADGAWSFHLESLRDHLYGQLKTALIVLVIASGLLLLIACINVANLMMSRATGKLREVALRRALGASQGRIVRQFLLESALLALVGGCVGLGTAFALVRAVATKLPGSLRLPGAVTVDWQIVSFAFAVTVLTGIAFGLAPAWLSRRVELNLTLKHSESRLAGSSGGRARNVFIAAQVGLSLVLLVGASLLAESLMETDDGIAAWICAGPCADI